MAAIPSWANSTDGRALIGQVTAEHPEYRITRGEWIEGGGERRYIGKASARLRKMYCDWLAREMAALDAQYEVSGHWDHEASATIFDVESADQLIARILGEAEQFVEVEHLAPGRIAA